MGRNTLVLRVGVQQTETEVEGSTLVDSRKRGVTTSMDTRSILRDPSGSLEVDLFWGLKG